MKPLREYQTETVSKVFEEIESGLKSGLICFATGLGKTKTAVEIAKRFNKILLITHTEELLNQTAYAFLREEDFCSQDIIDFIEQHDSLLDAVKAAQAQNLFASNNNFHIESLINHIGFIKREQMDLDAKITVASVATLWRRLDKIPADAFDLVIIDEAHKCLAKTWVSCAKHFKPKFLLGLTASPTRLDGQSLFNIFEKIIVEKDIKFGIDNGFLCEIDAIRIKTNLSLDKVRTVAGDFNEGELEELVDTPERNQLIVDSWKKYANGRQTLVACVTIEHAMNIAEAFNNAGVNSSFIVGDESVCPNRKERIALWKAEEITLISHVMVLVEGFDYPEISCVIMSRPTKSLVVFLQNIGRGLRLKEGRFKDCIILDIVDSTSRHSLVNSWTLDQEKAIEDRVFVSREKKDKLIEKREENRAKILGKVERDERVNLFKLPKMRVIVSEKMNEPASEKQLDWIERLGYDIVTNTYTKAMCAEIISNTPVSDKQRNWLKWKGYDVRGDVTIGIFSEAKAEIEKREAEQLATTGKKSFFRDLA